MSLITALNPGLTGILAQQKQVEITGNNIANVNTPGYSRQTATLSPNPAINIRGLFMGQGVSVEDVGREYDKFVTGRLFDQNCVLGRESAKSDPMAELERIFGIGEDSLASEIEGFFGAWHDLSQNPSGAVEREQVIYKGENLLNSFEQAESDMVGVRQNINDTLQAEVDGVNLKLQEVAELNADIKQRESLGHVANTERDRRDLLVKKLSKTLGIRTFETGEGQIGMQLPGGISLVEGNNASELQSYYEGGELRFRVRTGDIKVNADVRNFGGQFRGLLEVRDELVPELEESVGSLRRTIVTHVNSRHEKGWGLDGKTGRPFFSRPASYRSQTGFEDPRDLAFNTGELEIELNNGETVTKVQISQGQNSLNGIRDSINEADAGVLASVVKADDGSYRLDLTPEKQGDTVSIGDGSLAVDNEYKWRFESGFSEQSDFTVKSQDGYSDPDIAGFNKGTITLETGDPASPDEYNIDISSLGNGMNTLNGIRDAVNASGAGVHAAVEQGGDGSYYLSVIPPEKSVSASAETSEGEEFSIDEYFQSRNDPLSEEDIELTFDVEGEPGPVSVNVSSGNTSLEGIMSAVNSSADASDARIRAEIRQAGNSYKLDFKAYKDFSIDASDLSEHEDPADPSSPFSNNESYEFAGLEEIQGSEEIKVEIRDTDEIAAAGATEGSPGDNENALAIYSLAEKNLVDGDKTFVEGYGRIASRVGIETRRNTMARDGARDTMDQLENLRESTVGVSIEQEMINLIMFQKGFEASTKYVQTIDQMLGTIIGMRR